MFCTSCGAFDADSGPRCPVCGARVRLAGAPPAQATSRAVVRWILVALLLLGVGLGAQWRRERAAENASVYRQAEAALAAGDFEGAALTFGALGGYRDADERLDDVRDEAGPAQDALENAVATFDAGDAAGAIAKLDAILAEAPEFGPAQDLLASITAAHVDGLRQEADRAEARRDWLRVELALRALVRLLPEDAALAERLADVVRNHAPIAFVRDGAVFLIGPDGNDERALTKAMDAIFPSWSPDRSQIAFISLADRSEDFRGTLMLMNGDGSELQPIAEDALPYSWPVWSPDGRGIAFSSMDAFDSDTFTGSISLNVFEIETGIERNLTGDQLPHAAVPTWSPDGTEIAFVSNTIQRRTEGGIDLRDGDVYVVPANGGPVQNLTRNRIFDESWIQWSPAGERLLILTAPGDWLNPAKSRLFLLDLMRDELEEVVVDEWQLSLPFWSPDGTRIAYITGGDTANLWSDMHVQQIRFDSDVSSFVAWSPDGQALLVPGADDTLPSFVVELNSELGTVVSFAFDYDDLRSGNGPPSWGGITPMQVAER